MKRAERNQQILNAAKKCFIYTGYQETGMRDIAKEAGVALGTLYSYYKNKEELFKAIDLPELEAFRPKRERQKEYIFFSAINLFSEKGYENVSMQNIADACNITRVQLQSFFKCKEDLFKAMVLENSIVSYTDKLDTISTSAPLEEVLTKTAQNYFSVAKKKEQLLFLSEITRNSELFPELLDYYYKFNMIGPCIHLTHYIQRICKENGKEVPEMEAIRSRVSVFFASLQNYLITKYIMSGFHHGQSQESIIEGAVDVFMCYLKYKGYVEDDK